MLVIFICMLLIIAFPAAELIYLSKLQHNFYQIQYNAIDQCSNAGGLLDQKNAKFSLKFQLVNKCDGKGILICYPGMLDQKNSWMGYGMTPDVQFRINNQQQNSSVASRCHEEWTKCKKEAGKPPSRTRRSTFCGPSAWHGILLRTLRNDEDGRRRIVLTTSIGVKEYDFEFGRREFNIVLADRESLISYAANEGGDRIPFQHEDALRDAVMTNITRGVHLRHYGGLWMLGLDMLPFHQQQLLHLHVFRDCGCEMHAWFLRPDDPMPAPLDHLPPELATKKCASRVVRKPLHFALPRRATIGWSVRFSVRWNNRARGLIFSLANEREPQLFVFMLDRTTQYLNLLSKQQGSKFDSSERRALATYSRVPRQILNGTFDRHNSSWPWATMHFEIAIRDYLYEVCVQGVCFQRLLRRSGDWWLHKEADQITKLIIGRNSDVYPHSVDPPLVVRTEDLIIQNHCENSYRRMDPFHNECTFWLRGIVTKNSTFIHIEFLHNVPTYHEHLGAVVLSVKFDLIKSTFQLGYHIPGFFENQSAQDQFPVDLFQIDKPFECRILLKESEPGMPKSIDRFKVFVFSVSHTKGFELRSKAINRLTLSLRAINYVHVVTDVYMINKAMPHCGKDVKARRAMEEIWPPLSVGDRLLVQGKLLHSAQVLHISLLHDPLPFNQFVGDIPMRMEYNFTNRNLSIYSWIRDKNRDSHGLQFGRCLNCINTLHSEEEFKINIVVAEQWFTVMVRGKHVASYPHVLPPWAVNAIMVEGDYSDAVGHKIHVVWDRSRSHYFNKNQKHHYSLPYVAIIHRNDLVRKGEVITLNGILNGTAPRVNVSFLYQSLDTYDRLPPNVRAFANMHDKYIGLPLIMAMFDNDQLTINHTCLQPYLLCKQIRRPIAPLKAGKFFNLTIIPIARDGFIITLAGNAPVIVEDAGMPPWAAQYLRVEGDLKVDDIDRKPSSRIGCEI